MDPHSLQSPGLVIITLLFLRSESLETPAPFVYSVSILRKYIGNSESSSIVKKWVLCLPPRHDQPWLRGSPISFDSVACMMEVISRDEAKLLNAVQFNYKDADSMAKALGNASKIVMTVRPGEDGRTLH